jgi:phage repressor protein C with HTH and peptisase S24 domain
MFDTANMAEPGEPPIYAALMRVKPEDLSPNAWAARAKVGRAVWSDMRRHGNPTRNTLAKLLEAIGMTLAEFEGGSGTVRTEVRRSSVADFRQADGGLRGLPLLGTALGGEVPDLEGLDEDSADLIELDLGEVIDHLERPAALGGDRDAYALTILGDSMAPRFEPGERILVSPRAPVGIGDDVVVQLRGREGDDERVKLVLVKRLIRRSPGFVELRQFNPDLTFRVPVARLARDAMNRHRIHKVVGSVFRP